MRCPSYPKRPKAAAPNAETTVVTFTRCALPMTFSPRARSGFFFSGALNCHVVHHVLPSLPRSLHSTFAQKISDLYPNEYRAVHSTRELVSLFLLRHEVPTNNMQMKELWQIVAKRGPFPAMKQLFWDISSLLVLAYIVSCIPPEPMLS
mmetsp:Transcript_22496/g.49906  ORF Transcript_22496/g.49906 Transcript_22496/m.49906 type:complete len:149 (-) Transcript_22496:69-515(-)